MKTMIKNLILKLLGFDKASIERLKKEVTDLETTISNLKLETTQIYKKTELAFDIIKELNIDKNDELWWEKDNFSYNVNSETRRLADKIKKNAQIDWIKKYPSLKKRKIFHGGCIGCITPLEDGIGKCLGCSYLRGHGFPNLSRNK